MDSISHYDSPLGIIRLAADETGLTGLWFEGQKYATCYESRDYAQRDLPVFSLTKAWLDLYFSGSQPDFLPPLHPVGTPFQMQVWGILSTIPYGATMTYGQISKLLAEQHGNCRMSAQAVGGAVGRNPISILIPCHRVLGAKGSLTGYAGGLDRKQALLRLEKQG